MDFDDVAQKIVKNSIQTAICIDDDFLEPFDITSDPTDINFTRPQQLYNSFKSNNCLLDIYKFEPTKWEHNDRGILKNKDLLILDWELTTGDPAYRYALAILELAVGKNGIPFVCIYTHLPDIDKIVFNIYSYFSGLTQKNFAEKKANLIEVLDVVLEKENAEELLKAISNKAKDVLNSHDRLNVASKEITDLISTRLDSKEKKEFCKLFYQKGKELFESNENLDFLVKLYLAFNNENLFFNESNKIPINIQTVEDSSYVFLINGTLLKISQKQGDAPYSVKPEAVYADLSKSICNRPRNFLSLLNLELRDIYKRNALSIISDLVKIDELAFFYHQDNLRKEGDEAFIEFLRLLWKEDLAYQLFSLDSDVLRSLDDYKQKNAITEQLTAYKKNISFSSPKISDLARLNFYYSLNRSKDVQSRQVRFGDIFNFRFSDEGPGYIQKKNYSYLLCVTPHCDCLHPQDKINNNFHFVLGKECKLSTGLTKPESEWLSFYENASQKIICIQWETKPFTLHINQEDNDLKKNIRSSLTGSKIELSFLGNQKENYTQRIANQSFGHANRVGINFVGIEESKERAHN